MPKVQKDEFDCDFDVQTCCDITCYAQFDKNGQLEVRFQVSLQSRLGDSFRMKNFWLIDKKVILGNKKRKHMCLMCFDQIKEQ